ncbi:hypothetical protein FRB96_007672 [Tulasnella sp. 330]|nr:hypothetical protein FRB96_007672 [Tulasnella sp. 330]KAG8880753.1 hypothetical protein FRB97_000546 [Tulasnella sp. 331]
MAGLLDPQICSLQPTNDYKTSVLSGLSPTIILEICSRAMSFWTYQTHQESSFQTALLRNANEKNATLSKQLENIIREANTEIDLRTNKISLLERDLELERKKTRELSDASREKDKEYQKLKNHYDSIKRKALLAPSNPQQSLVGDQGGGGGGMDTMELDPSAVNRTRQIGAGIGSGVSMGDVVNGMEANRIQRTPIRPAAGGGFSNPQQWQQPRQPSHQTQNQQRRPFTGVQQQNQQHPFNEAYGFGNGSLTRGGGKAASDSEELIEEIPQIIPSNPPAYRSLASSRSGNGNQGPYSQVPGSSGGARNLVSAGMPMTTTRRTAPVLVQPSMRRSSGGFRPAPFAGG